MKTSIFACCNLLNRNTHEDQKKDRGKKLAKQISQILNNQVKIMDQIESIMIVLETLPSHSDSYLHKILLTREITMKSIWKRLRN